MSKNTLTKTKSKEVAIIKDLCELRNAARAELRELIKPNKDAPDPLADKLAVMFIAPLLMGIRFGLTASILAVKHRMKHPSDEPAATFDKISHRLCKKIGGDM